MKKNVKVIVWKTDGAEADGTPVYRLDEKGAGARFFRDMLNNAETDGRESFSIEEMSQAAWKKACRIGKEMA